MAEEIAKKCLEGNTDTSKHNSKYKSHAFVITAWKEPPFLDCMRYLAYAKEICPKTGREHWQTFAYTKNQMTNLALAKKIGDGAHVEYMRGSFKNNKDYCSKEGLLTEHGDPPAQGIRVDLEELKERILNGESSSHIIMENPYYEHAYGRTIQKLEDIISRKRKRTQMTEALWIYGPTGSGKSHLAHEMIGDQAYYNWTPDKGWWDQYNGQPYVYMDDFRGEVPFNILLRLADKWPFSVPRRGREPMPFTSEKLIITSSKHPDHIYAESNDDLRQLHRRFKILHHLGHGWSQFTEEELSMYKESP